jgi:hypothetical protein
VRPFGVVAVPPVFADGAHFGKGREDPGIKYFLPEAAVVSLDIGVLIRITRFDESEVNGLDPISWTPDSP